MIRNIILLLSFLFLCQYGNNSFSQVRYTGANIDLSVSTADYNTKRVGSLSGFTFDITNRGSSPLTITGVTFSTPHFTFDNTNAVFPVTINTQRTRTFRIWFNPTVPGTFNDSAVFSTNAANSNTAKIILTGTGQDNGTTLGEIFWEGNIPDNPNTSSDDFQPKSLKQIGDVNSDGKHDIICATENYWTICYNGNASVTADTLWKFNTHFGTNNTGSVDWEDAMQIMDDLNGDGVQEVVIGCGGGNEEVYVLSGKTGALLWEYPGPGTNYDGDVFGLRVDKDYNSDGRKDVLISASGEGTSTGRHAVICLNAVNGSVIFNMVQTSDFTYDVSPVTTGGVIGFGSNGGPYGVKGYNNSGVNQWSYPTTSSVWSLREVPDINGDGNTDVVGLWGFSGGIFALSGNNGTPLWANSLSTSNNGTVEILDDFDNNSYPDLTFSGPQTAFRIDGKTNTILWTKGLFSSYIRDAGYLGDVTGDALGEVLYSTQNPAKVFVLDGTDGDILFEFLFGTLTHRADRITRLDNIDGNTSNEFVACSRDGRIKCFSGGPNGVVGLPTGNNSIPKSFALYQNYPNPFNPITNIKYQISKSGFINLVVYDLLGKSLIDLVNRNQHSGTYLIDFTGIDLSSGVYFYSLIADGTLIETRKMILVK